MVKDNTYIHIESFMVKELKLKGNELLVYAIIYGFSMDGESVFNGSLQYLVDWTNSTKQGIIKVLKKLQEKRLIEKQEIIKDNMKFCSYKAVNKVEYYETKFNGGIKQSLTGYSTKFNGGIKQSLPNTIYNTIENTIDNIYEQKNEEKKDFPSLINREPKNDIEKIEKQYLLNYVKLYQQKKLALKTPCVNWGKARKLSRSCIDQYGEELILEAINKSMDNDFCIENGYNICMILSSGVLSRLINGKKITKNALEEFEHSDKVLNDVIF